jgi:hypothetical protein
MVMMDVKNIQNLCPVCGYEMEEPPVHYNICPSCGTEFGVNDVNASVIQLRNTWIANGLQWWSKTDACPKNWNPYQQLARVSPAGVGAAITTTADNRQVDVRPYPETVVHSDMRFALECT